APAHLAKCMDRVQSKSSGKNCFGHVQCPCGSRRMKLWTTNGFYEQEDVKRPQAIEHGQFIIKAVCADCASEHVLFDAHQHGWNAVVCQRSVDSDMPEPEVSTRPVPSLVPWHCQACGTDVH